MLMVEVVTGQDFSCNVCTGNGTLGNALGYYNNRTCEKWNLLGKSGILGNAQCAILQSSSDFQQACQCYNPIDLKGQVVLVLLNVTNAMSPSIVQSYQNSLITFYADRFKSTTNWPAVLYGWNAVLDSQELFLIEPNSTRRTLRSTTQRNLAAQVFPLATRVTVTAKSTKTLGASSFQQGLQTVADSNQALLLQAIQNTGSSVVASVFFRPLLSIQTFGPNDVITTPRVQAVLDPGSLTVNSTQTPATDSSSLSPGAIAGITAACVFVTCVIMVMVWAYYRGRHTDIAEKELEEQKNSISAGQSMRYSHLSQSFEPAAASQSRSKGQADGTSMRSASSSRYRSKQLGALRASSTQVLDSTGKTVSVLDGDASRNYRKSQLLGSSKVAPETAPVLVLQQDARKDGFSDEHIPEEPEAEEQYETVEHEVEDQQPYEEETPIIEDQEEELLAAPPVLPSTMGQPQEQLEQQGQIREVMAPPGKLGIVIETTLEGPLVHKVNPSSPLVGLVFEGDLISAIDDVDTRAMSASAITALMVRTADKHRRILIKSA